MIENLQIKQRRSLVKKWSMNLKNTKNKLKKNINNLKWNITDSKRKLMLNSWL
jgi:hypothetical protein